MDAYEKLEKVGEGTYGKVYKAIEKTSGKIVALKKTRLPEDEEGVPPTTLREVSILRMLSIDPHVVRCWIVHLFYPKLGALFIWVEFLSERFDVISDGFCFFCGFLGWVPLVIVWF